jgi:hypothetical protein
MTASVNPVVLQKWTYNLFSNDPPRALRAVLKSCDWTSRSVQGAVPSTPEQWTDLCFWPLRSIRDKALCTSETLSAMALELDALIEKEKEVVLSRFLVSTRTAVFNVAGLSVVISDQLITWKQHDPRIKLLWDPKGVQWRRHTRGCQTCTLAYQTRHMRLSESRPQTAAPLPHTLGQARHNAQCDTFCPQGQRV